MLPHRNRVWQNSIFDNILLSTVHPSLALQLWTVRAQIENDYIGTLRTLAKSGYTAIEPFTLLGLSATKLRSLADDLGLRVPAMHFGYERLRNNIDTVIAEALALGCVYVVCAGVPAYQTVNEWLEAAHELNIIGQCCIASGLQLVYHNEYDFARMGETCGFEVLANTLSPSLVQFELDVFCAAASGGDPVAWLNRLDGRLPLVHLENGEPRSDPPSPSTWLGEGNLSMTAIVQAAQKSGAQWLIVEHDRALPDPIVCATKSLKYLTISIGA